ncbi:unnamed protein product [Protopolystoma xenopodis]|uniref:Uncharacterized protein n=1 Tax=Protopolystoma xenopodis TaxID=117903 RepID=A0A448X508_9PLAT|nr:unnamed protein product [Protopolystoma xenopodis]
MSAFPSIQGLQQNPSDSDLIGQISDDHCSATCSNSKEFVRKEANFLASLQQNCDSDQHFAAGICEADACQYLGGKDDLKFDTAGRRMEIPDKTELISPKACNKIKVSAAPTVLALPASLRPKILTRSTSGSLSHSSSSTDFSSTSYQRSLYSSDEDFFGGEVCLYYLMIPLDGSFFII